ncbi:MAG: hypothetical protein E7632_03965 [Ruminococcaceae bacterium]|nr:hypothetical protein [Oscillospiraceae bacterium]
MKKRTISVILLTAMLVSLAACGEAAQPSDTTGADTSSADTTEAVGEVSSLPAEYDLGGYEFRLLRQTPAKIAWSLNEFAPAEQTGEVLNDAFYDRNAKMMEKYNFTITTIEKDSGVPATVSQSVLAGDDEYDTALLRSDEVKQNAYLGTYMNLYDLKYLDLEKSWWSQSIVRDMTVDGVLPLITGDIIVCENESMNTIIYNSSLGRDFNIENLYQTVRDGKWTMDKMLSCMKLVNADLDSNGTWDENDRWGMLYADNAAALPWFACTETYTFTGSGDSIEYSANSERAYAVYELVQSFLSDKTMAFDWARIKTDTAIRLAGMMSNKQALFANMVLSFVRRNLRDVTADFGVLPMPKLDEAQESYATSVSVSTPYVFVPSSVGHPDEVGFILEALASESKPITETYYKVAMQSKYTRDEESYEMIELMMQNIIFDTGFVMDFGGITNEIRKGVMGDNGYASLLGAGESAAIAALEEFYEKVGEAKK